MSDRKPVLLRIDPAVHDALARWAADDLRSLNAQIEVVLRRALSEVGEDAHAGRSGAASGPAPGRGAGSRGGIARVIPRLSSPPGSTTL